VSGRLVLLIAIIGFIGYFSFAGFPTLDSSDINLDRIEKEKSEVKAPANARVTKRDAVETQQVLQADKPVVLLFSANWCGGCRQFKPYFKEAQKRIGDGYRYVIVDVDKNPALADKFNIRSIPTVWLYDKENSYKKKIDLRYFEEDLTEYLKHRK